MLTKTCLYWMWGNVRKQNKIKIESLWEVNLNLNNKIQWAIVFPSISAKKKNKKKNNILFILDKLLCFHMPPVMIMMNANKKYV